MNKNRGKRKSINPFKLLILFFLNLFFFFFVWQNISQLKETIKISTKNLIYWEQKKDLVKVKKILDNYEIQFNTIKNLIAQEGTFRGKNKDKIEEELRSLEYISDQIYIYRLDYHYDYSVHLFDNRNQEIDDLYYSLHFLNVENERVIRIIEKYLYDTDKNNEIKVFEQYERRVDIIGWRIYELRKKLNNHLN